jgi:inner membrane protein COX18
MVVVPTAAQLPVFVLSSMTAWQMCTSPTPLDAESFFSLTSLTHPDPIFALPIAVGMITFANVETSLWFRDPAAVERAQQVEKWSSERRARGETVLRTGDFLKNLGRGAALARILWAATIPGVSRLDAACSVNADDVAACLLQGVALVWVTSAAYGLVQNWVFDYWDARRRRQLQAASASAPAATTLPRKPTTTKPKRPKQTSPS